MAARVRRAGGTLIEERPVAAVVPDATGVTVVLRDGAQVRADRVVVATGAYTATIDLPEPPGGRVVHAHMQAGPIRDAPGRPDLFGAAIGLGSAYWRWHGGRLLVGGADGHRATDPRAQRSIARRRDRYVTAATGTMPEYRWSGPILVRRGELPLLTHSPSSPLVTYAFGFAGSGVALATSAGPLVRDLVLGPAAADPAAALLRVAIAATGA
jgi:glycine/D-amino acid oxidase-like deaminating enzyme